MSDILLGTSASQLVNFLYLITKQFIYFCRCKNMKPTFEKLFERISFVRNTEYRIANLQNSLIKHNKHKYEMLYAYMSNDYIWTITAASSYLGYGTLC